MFDLIIRGALVVDPLNKVNAIKDLAVSEGKIAAVKDEISLPAKKLIEASGKVLIPGIIDMHTHMRTVLGHKHAQRMIALAGVCTTLDMAGPLEDILTSIPGSGAGVNIAILDAARDGQTLTSSRGIEAGARTGLCALFLAGFFALTLFVAPLLTLVPAFATACVLIIVGYMMLQGTASRINFSDITTGLPCFLTIFMMPFTFNIATGLAFGVISFVLLKLLAGKKEEITLTMAVLAVVFVGILISH